MKDLVTNPYVFGGIVSIVLGILVYFFLPQYSFPVYGIPVTTALLSIVGLAAVYMGIKQ